LPQLKNGVLKPGWVVDLSAVAELRTISDAPDGGLRIGASVTARELELDARVRSRFPALAESAAMVGSVQVRNLATLGGNLCNAAPSADMAPPLLALDAEAVIAGPSGRRRFHGLVLRRPHRAAPGGCSSIVVPAQGATAAATARGHARRELDIAVVGVTQVP
jgi:carbon-monoxide dehydrogenase medium subunit